MSRGALFDIEGATWDAVNKRVLALDFTTAQRVVKRLRSEGYIPTTFKPHVHDWMSAGSFWDFEGRHEGRANGRNEWVTLDCWNAEGHRPWSLILRTKEGPWATYAEGDNQLFWGGDILVEEVIGRCRRANPNAIDLTPWDFELLGEPSTELS